MRREGKENEMKMDVDEVVLVRRSKDTEATVA